MRKLSDESRRKMSEAARNRCTPEWRKRKSEAYSTKLDLEKVKSMYSQGFTQKEIADELGVSQKVVWRFMKNNGIQARVAMKRDQKGSNNSSWKGGKSKTNRGYVTVRMPSHPRAKANGYVFEHILIAEKMLGRELKFMGMHHPDSEIVHHINENKRDNRPENLKIMTVSDHVKLHNSIRRLSKGGDAHAN